MTAVVLAFTIFFTFTVISHQIEGKRSRKLEDSGCGQFAFHYEFTECDATNGRWRVAIPSKGCDGTPPIPPKRLDECYKSCESGTFLNMTTMECEECDPGTYSMGGGIRYDEWDPLPNAFEINVEKFHSVFSPASRQYSKVDCKVWGWRPKGDVLLSQGGPCVATLSLTTELVKSGNIKFTYQYSDDSVLFQFQANSDKCENSEGSRWPALTGEGIWRTEEVPLRRGLNSIKFLTMGIDDHKPKPILIRKIEIEGIGYASSCNGCPPGTKSSRNASTCTKCQVNTFSLHKSSQCFPCPNNFYSETGSRNCTEKSYCNSGDYYQMHTPCDKNNKTRIVYKWIEPRICLEDHENSAQLPPPGPFEDCPPCNPGTEYRDKSCKPCPENYYSDGLATCTRCPSMSVPDTSHRLAQWYSWPYNVHITCISPEGCNESPAWQLNGNYISNGKGHADWVYLVMTLTIGGFRSLGGVINGEQLEVGRLTFLFETKCPQDCELLLMQSTSTRNATVVQRWIGSNDLQEVTHIILRNDTYNFSWAFQKVAWDSTGNSDGKNSWSDSFWPRSSFEEENIAKIYTINVTNTIDGGASSCITCQDGFKYSDSRQNKGSCLTCSPGHFRTTIHVKSQQNETLDPKNVEPKTVTKCEKCPEGTITLSTFATNSSACKQCGPGLISTDGLSCTTDCLVKIGGYSYDLSPLKGYHMVRGSSLFTASGTQYFHIYNISFCTDGNARCDKNVSLPHGYDTQQNPTVEALICQSTIFPATAAMNLEVNSNDNEYPVSSPKPLSTHAGSLGDHLVGISHSPSVLGVDVAHAIEEHMDHPYQFHFFYSTPDPTPACPHGRSTTITFRCKMPSASWSIAQSDNLNTQDEEIRIPQKCPDATCDGCNYQFLWETAYACHLCSYDELTIVRGECKNGFQDVHYLNSPHSLCLLKYNESWPTSQKCKNHLPLLVEIAIQAAIGLTLLLSVLLICFWRRHRKLEYKYMKLVASGASGTGTSESSRNAKSLLPVPETCGLDPDEAEDDEDDQFSYNGHAEPNMSGQMREIGFYSDGGFKNFVSKFSVFNKIKSLTRKGNETGSNMEIMNLTDKEAVS